LRRDFIEQAAGWEQTVALIDATDLRAACRGFKKRTGAYSASGPALGGRTLKTGQSRCFVGYKKHTLRLWWRAHTGGVLLIPLVELGHSGQCLGRRPVGAQLALLCATLVLVAGSGRGRHGLSGGSRQATLSGAMACRRGDQAARGHETGAALYRLEPDGLSQGQPLEWLGYMARQDRHWFGVADSAPLCSICWQAPSVRDNLPCPRRA